MHLPFLCILLDFQPQCGQLCHHFPLGMLSSPVWPLLKVQICDNNFSILSGPEDEFWDKIQTKVFLLAIPSHLYSFALRFLFLKIHATSYTFYSSFTVHGKGEERRKTLIEKHTEPLFLWF